MATGLDALRAELEQRTRITARVLASEWEDQLQTTSPVDTGNMRQQTVVRDERTSEGARVTARVDTDYARYVAEGTRPHEIVPRNARALRFTVGGRTVFATRVMHPGTQGNAWWDESLNGVADMTRRIWNGLR